MSAEKANASSERRGGSRSIDETQHCSARVWPAAHLLLEHCAEQLPRHAAVLELGSGTGWFGIELTSRRPDLSICVTEMLDYGAYHRLEATVSSIPSDGRLCCAAFDWSQPPPPMGHFDFVVGSDLVYSVCTASLLGAVIRSLLVGSEDCSCKHCLLAHTAERWGACGFDANLLASLRAHSLVATPLGPPASMVSDDAPIEQRGVLFCIDALPVCSIDAAPCDTSRLKDAAAERVLLRAARAQALIDARAKEAMTADELQEVETTDRFACILNGTELL